MIRRLGGIARRNGAHFLHGNGVFRPVWEARRPLFGGIELADGHTRIQSIGLSPGMRFFSAQQQADRQRVDLDDFQHEEITGPTVERDESATAEELRASIASLLQANSKVKRALVGVGVAQFIAGMWVIASDYAAETLCLLLTAFTAGMSLHLAYHFHATMKHVPFFQRVEERSRMRVLTLSMQTIKAATQALSRANVIMRTTAVALLGACIYEALVPREPKPQEP